MSSIMAQWLHLKFKSQSDRYENFFQLQQVCSSQFIQQLIEMDNIGQQVYIFTSILLIFALILLISNQKAVYIDRENHSVSQILITMPDSSSLDPHTHLFNQTIPLTSSSILKVNEAKKEIEWQKQDNSDQSYLLAKYKKIFSTRNGLLSKCNAGLSKINIINKRYLCQKLTESLRRYYKEYKKGRKDSKKYKKDCFEPTCLPPIIEGIQY